MEANKDILVVKYGSTCVAPNDVLDYGLVDQYAEQLAEVSDQYGLVVVSSGSIAVGRTLWREQAKNATRPVPEPSEQVLAMLGSAQAVAAWQSALAKYNLQSGQIQVTHHEIRDEYEGSMLVQTMRECLDYGIVSIVNENDALSDEEIKKVRYGGDNDGLARYVAAALGASRLCLLTSEVEGLQDETGEVVTMVDSRLVRRAIELAGPADENGMGTKVMAATSAAASGVRVHIANPAHSLKEILNRQHGTYFAPHTAKT